MSIRKQTAPSARFVERCCGRRKASFRDRRTDLLRKKYVSIVSLQRREREEFQSARQVTGADRLMHFDQDSADGFVCDRCV